jgi:predicted alpha/beta-hydrolase family hydrolase
MAPIEGLLERPRGARALYVLAHGAGAGMRHPFMAAVAERLATRKVATFRYEFAYMAAGRRRPDPPHLLEARVREAVETAAAGASGLPLIAGGKSLGGRMTSRAAAAGALPEIRGLVYLGFPLHAPGRPSDKRAAHLGDLRVPQLFLQGTRDNLADLDLIRGVCQRLGSSATLHIVDGGDHSFKVLKRSGRNEDEVLDEIADTVEHWLDRIL